MEIEHKDSCKSRFALDPPLSFEKVDQYWYLLIYCTYLTCVCAVYCVFDVLTRYGSHKRKTDIEIEIDRQSTNASDDDDDDASAPLNECVWVGMRSARKRWNEKKERRVRQHAKPRCGLILYITVFIALAMFLIKLWYDLNFIKCEILPVAYCLCPASLSASLPELDLCRARPFYKPGPNTMCAQLTLCSSRAKFSIILSQLLTNR